MISLQMLNNNIKNIQFRYILVVVDLNDVVVVLTVVGTVIGTVVETIVVERIVDLPIVEEAAGDDVIEKVVVGSAVVEF